MADNFDVRQFLFENKLGAYSKLKENENIQENIDFSSWKVLKGPGGMIFQMQGPNGGVIDARVNKSGQAILDGEGQEGVDAIKQIAAQFNAQATSNDDTSSVTITKADLKTLFTGINEAKNKEEGYMGTQYDSSEDMAVDMVKKGITEREVIYVVRDGRCYRKDDEGNMDEVNMSYCKRFAEGKEEVEEAVSVKSVQKAEMSLQNLLKNIATNANIPTDEKEGLINALGELQDFVDEVGYDSEMEDEYVSDYSRRRASELKEDEHKDPIKENDIFGDIEDDIMYGSDDKEDAIEYLREIIDFCEKKIVELENEQGFEDEENDLEEAFGGKNPEGDKLVLRFLQGVAKKFNYPVAQAAIFVKNTIKSLGY